MAGDEHPARWDLVLQRQLREAERRFDPVPARLLRAASDAFDLRSIDAELAELVFDSLMDQAPALVRGPDEPRLLTFRSGPLSIEVEVLGDGPRRRLIGRLVPAQPAEIDCRHGDVEVTIAADELGRFTVSPLAAGPLRLRCDAAGGAVVTDWVTA